MASVELVEADLSDIAPIALLENAKSALIEAKSLSDVQHILNTGIAFAAYARAEKLGTEIQNTGTEVVIRAQRKMGEMLDEILPGPGRPIDNSTSAVLLSAPTLEELGITRNQSSRYQKLASIDEQIVDEHIEEVKASGKPLTIAGVNKLAAIEPKEPKAENSLTRVLGLRKWLRSELAEWPADEREAFGDQLIIIGQEIHSNGSIA